MVLPGGIAEFLRFPGCSWKSSIRERRRETSSCNCSELFPADGDMAGQGLGQPVLKVKSALFGAGGWTRNLLVYHPTYTFP